MRGLQDPFARVNRVLLRRVGVRHSKLYRRDGLHRKRDAVPADVCVPLTVLHTVESLEAAGREALLGPCSCGRDDYFRSVWRRAWSDGYHLPRDARDDGECNVSTCGCCLDLIIFFCGFTTFTKSARIRCILPR